jgi:hypothetical protein
VHRLAVVTMTFVLGLALGSSASAQVPTPPLPPHPPGLDELDPLGLLFDFPALGLDLPQCAGDRSCDVGPKQVRCHKNPVLSGSYRSCTVKLAGAVAECTDWSENYHGALYHDRICHVTVGNRTIARCEDRFEAYIEYSRYRSCSVGGVAYTCERPWGGPAERCAVTGVPGRQE